ncbi:MAG: right-handed parallel beta-helix repeat-containing protein [Verrucomicrobiales bacterium]|nr:right-handed parallel beta-helix repeat-containing protein [Verrucomicrobiales bacterium]
MKILSPVTGLFWIATTAALVLLPGIAEARIYYVDSTNAPGGNGQSWGDAFHDLREALDVVRDRDEIWLKKGNYVLAPGHFHSSRLPYPDIFLIERRIALRGGFSGTERYASDRGALNPVETILDGNRSEQIIKVQGYGRKEITIEGVSIRNSEAEQNLARGIAIDARGNRTDVLRILNCEIRGNRLQKFNGRTRAVWVVGMGAQVKHTRCIANQNLAGLCFMNSHAVLENCVSTDNFFGVEAFTTGSNSRSITIRNSIFETNTDGIRLNGMDATIVDTSAVENDFWGGYIRNQQQTGAFKKIEIIRSSFSENGRDGLLLSGRVDAACHDIECRYNVKNGLSITGEVTGEFDDSQFNRNLEKGIRTEHESEDLVFRNFTVNENRTVGVDLRIGGAAFINGEISGNGQTGLELDPFPFGNSVSATLMNVVFSSNKTSQHGGAIRNGGHLKAYFCTFAGNSALDEGDAISEHLIGTDPPETTVVASIFWANEGSGIPVSTPLSQNSVLNQMNQDPLFVRMPNPASSNFGDLRLTANSPAIDIVFSLAVPLDEFDIDKDGNTTEPLPRDREMMARTVGDCPDAGAYEFNPLTSGRNAGSSAKSLSSSQKSSGNLSESWTDLMIGKSSTSLKGGNIYNTSGVGQKVSRYPGKSGKLHFTAENDGILADTLRIRRSRGSRYFRVRFFQLSGGITNISGEIRTGSYFLDIDSMKSHSYRMNWRKKRQRNKSAGLNIALIAHSNGGGKDVVLAD